MDLNRTLGITIDPSGAVSGGARAAGAFNQVGRAAVDASGKMRDAQGRFVGLGGSARTAADGMAKAAVATTATGRAFASLRAGAGSLVGAFTSMKGAIIGLGLGVLTKQLVDTQVAMDQVAMRMKFAAGGAEEGGKALEWVRNVSKTLGLEFKSTAGEFSKFAAAAKGGKLSFLQTQEIFLAVAKASTVMGLSQEQVAGTFMALQQMISKGNVQAEELRGQLGERLPGAFGLAAKAMGVTTQELGKMLELGKVSAADLLPKLAKELEKTFGGETAEASFKLTAEMNRLANAWTEFKLALLDAGVLTGLKAILDVLKQAVDFSAMIVKNMSASGLLSRLSMMNPFNPGSIVGALTDPNPTGAPKGPSAVDLAKRQSEIAALAPSASGSGILQLETYRTSRPFLGGASEEIKKLQDGMTQWRKAGGDAVNAMEAGFTGFFRNVVSGTMTVTAAFKEMAKNILADIATILLRAAIAQPIAAALGGAMGIAVQGPAFNTVGGNAAPGGGFTSSRGSFHMGGIVGTSGTNQIMAPDSLFAGAPRFHNGLRPDEFPAILQRGEEVIPRNEVGRGRGGLSIPVSVTVNMNGSDGTKEDGQKIGAEVSRQLEGMVRAIIVRERMPRGALT